MATIKEWHEDDRPREKLVLKGTAALSNSELLAILINHGTKDKSAVELAKELLQKNNNDLKKLSRLSVNEILQLKIKGIGVAKAVSIAAALELGIRRDATEKNINTIKSSKDLAAFLKAKFQYLTTEIFAVVYLNNSNKIIHHEIVSEGGITSTIVDHRIILKNALVHGALGIVLCHNHPSGNLVPSEADKKITHKIKQAASLLDINLLDHIIVSDEGYFSFFENNMV
ncbi:MAG: DNA repair protein RadC [Chitinophagaceae bacterium]|nr:DNA repair protein RadC [Chitinophagaceae bacterium]MCW5905739.1 DNA repair protein RadC [Chitinophagaceae bacterium]